MVYKFFDKKIHVRLLKKLCKMVNLLKNYISQLLKKIEKQKVHSSFIDNIWGADLAVMQLTKVN